MVSVNPSAIPEELRERDQWLLWDNRADKPRRPHWRGDFAISWSDPDDWHPFTEALAASQDCESWGIGYVMALDNDDHPRGIYACLDLDGCLDGGAAPEDWLPSLSWAVDEDAYIERSPSGDGLHIPLFNPDVPDWWADSHFSADEHQGVELLTNKFCTFTGDQLGDQHDGVLAADPTEFLFESYQTLNDEAPRDPTVDGSAEYDDDLDREFVETLLGHVSSNTDYTRWRNVLFALHDWDSGAQGKSVAKQWSRGPSWDDDSERLIESIWDRRETPANAISVGTLFHHARQGGWEPEQRGTDGPPSVEELVARYSDEYDDPDNVPDVLDTDGGETNAEDDGHEAQRDADNDDGQASADWDEIYQAYRAAEDAEERLTPRHEAAMQLLDENEWRTIEDNDIIWTYDADSGIYRDNGVTEARTRLSRQLNEQYRKHEQREILAQVRGRTTVAPDQLGGPPKYICAENCVIEIDADGITTHDHDPSYEFVGRVQTHYDATAECPAWQSFLDDVMPRADRASDRDKIQEFAGYMLMHWGLPHHKSLFLVGPTASGKSTFLDAIRTMLGTDSVANLTPQQMTSERFGGSELYGCWANIRNDIPDDLIENTGQFKEIVAGDPIKAERKFKQPFMFEPTAKHAFSANALPEPSTDDNAFFRRVMLVSFREQIPAGDRDKHLDDKLEAEHAGILNWCLEGLRRLIDQGGFTGTVAPWQTEQKWQKWADSVKRFHKDCLEEASDGFVPSAKIYGVYRQFCQSEGIPQMVEMSQLVHDLSSRFNYEQDRQYVDGDLTRGLAYAGLSDYGGDLVAELED